MDLSGLTPAHAVWAVAAAATAGVVLRPFRLPEAIWAVAGAVLLVVLQLVRPEDALAAVMRGTDVYLFLTGMMLAAELARREGLFDWIARYAVAHSRGSKARLFVLVYLVGTAVTALLSNDATAVVLTPAVYAATRAARVEPLPYLLVCAFIANAASFVLPISNPANLVVFGAGMPSLGQWIPLFLAPSIASILLTFAVLWATQRRLIRGKLGAPSQAAPLTRGGLVAAIGLLLTAVAILTASALDRPLGLPTAAAGIGASLLVLLLKRESPMPLVRGVAWSVLPLVAGLFVLVDAVGRTGVLGWLVTQLNGAIAASPAGAAWAAGLIVALASNLMNNLPAGLLAGSTVQAADAPAIVRAAVLIGVDLGPNLSVTGSLATILWLLALRREGEHVGAWSFLKLGVLVTPPALVGALAALVWLTPR
jgi:arsenical pump membrane protein